MAATQTKEKPKANPASVHAHGNGHTESSAQTANPETAKAEAPKGIEWEKKLSTTTVLGKKLKPSLVENGPVKLYSIIGVCTGTKSGESQYGAWTAFTGAFEAVRLADGKVFGSTVAFIPEPASGMMISALKAAYEKNGGDADVSIRFAFIIGVKASDKSATGYEYTVEPVQTAEQNDALAELRALMAPRVKAIAQQPAGNA